MLAASIASGMAPVASDSAVMGSHRLPSGESESDKPTTAFRVRCYLSSLEEMNPYNHIVVSMPEDMPGKIYLNAELISSRHLSAYITNGKEEIPLTPFDSFDHEAIVFRPVRLPADGVWRLFIPDGYLTGAPEVREVTAIPADEEALRTLSVGGAWHVKGSQWNGRSMFSIHDDDTVDTFIEASTPSEWMNGGYLSLLYPVLESLGLRGCLSMEGRRVGFTKNPPVLNTNGQLALRLQNEKGWEVQSHSMGAVTGDVNWWVESLDTPQASRIMDEGVFLGRTNNFTTTVYDASTGVQYYADVEGKRWIESKPEAIKPYVLDYDSHATLMYNPAFPVDYQWGEWFRLAREFGFRSNAWVTYGPSSSHANVPLINEIAPCGFETDGETFYNLPPLRSTCTRLMLEGQSIQGYQGERGTDNTYNKSHLKYFKEKIDEAADCGGWVVMGLHAYRPCWVNRLPGKLVSEGGDYPDAWVFPLGETPFDEDIDLTAPPAALGIRDWSEWHPCPGTRLYMLWEVLKYARDKGMWNVTSSEGYREMGNKVAVGYCNRGIQIGPDKEGFEGTRDIYPHYIVGRNDEVYYYQDMTGAVEQNVRVSPTVIDVRDNSSVAYGIDGTVVPLDTSAGVGAAQQLPPGVWIINNRKVLVR